MGESRLMRIRIAFPHTVRRPKTAAFILLATVALHLGGCSDDGTPETPSPTKTVGSPATATTQPNFSLSAPTSVRLRGALPNTSATVPPGGGELGRVTVEWDASGTATGFRIYLSDCAGTVTRVADVGASERSFGPLQPCRPGGRVGVSALAGTTETTIVWHTD